MVELWLGWGFDNCVGLLLVLPARVPGGGGWWGVCKVIIVSNPTRLRLGYG